LTPDTLFLPKRLSASQSDVNHYAAVGLFFVGNTVVAISYRNDVGVFEFVDFNTKLTIRDDRAEATVSGSHRYFTELGVVGDPTTNYTLACGRSKHQRPIAGAGSTHFASQRILWILHDLTRGGDV
jgi:hypothetical protein